jgi:hypothetical protein
VDDSVIIRLLDIILVLEMKVLLIGCEGMYAAAAIVDGKECTHNLELDAKISIAIRILFAVISWTIFDSAVDGAVPSNGEYSSV